jgi:LysM repeat protein
MVAMRRYLVLALAAVVLAVLFAIPQPAQAQGTADCPIRIVMEDTLLLRATPAFGTITTTLRRGDIVCLVGRNAAASWVQVSRPAPNPALLGWAPSNAFWTTVPITVLQITDGSVTPPPTNPPPTQGTYVVQRGDTVFSIARRYNITIPALVAANNIGANYLIYVGQVLVIPGTTTTPPTQPGYTTYVVKQGDYLVRIATQYGLHWSTLAQVNNIAWPYIIFAGQTLLIPTTR